jgi:predicted RecB family nuclease
VAGDIKSGAGEEGDDDSEKPKKHYAVQLALYTDILESLGLSKGRFPFVWDIHSEKVVYDLDAPQVPKTSQTLWGLYREKLAQARDIVSRPHTTLPALGATCKLCHWRSHCTRQAERLDDLTLIAELGRAKRDLISPHIHTVADLARIDPSALSEEQSRRRMGGCSLSSGSREARLGTAPRLQRNEARGRVCFALRGQVRLAATRSGDLQEASQGP